MNNSINQKTIEVNDLTMGEIEVNSLTKDYGHGRGIFDVTFIVKKGETFGFLGPNGAGKTTTMRHLMGFSQPQKGSSHIFGKDCWKKHSNIMKNVGYLPGEVVLPEGLTGRNFLQMMSGMRANKEANSLHAVALRMNELIERFDVSNLDGSIKRLSVGEKRKLAIVAAFMSDPQVLLLDEPTSGLDPVMQETFISFVQEEKQRGKTILLSSHIFSEVEALCDRIAIIKDGKLVSIASADEVKHYKRKTFDIYFADVKGFSCFMHDGFDIRTSDPDKLFVSAAIDGANCEKMVKVVSKYKLISLVEHQQTLEEYFMQFYKNKRTFGGLRK